MLLVLHTFKVGKAILLCTLAWVRGFCEVERSIIRSVETGYEVWRVSLFIYDNFILRPDRRQRTEQPNITIMYWVRRIVWRQVWKPLEQMEEQGEEHLGKTLRTLFKRTLKKTLWSSLRTGRRTCRRWWVSLVYLWPCASSSPRPRSETGYLQSLSAHVK